MNAMNWKLRFASAANSVFSWQVVAYESLAILMVWGAYVLSQMLLADPATKEAVPTWFADLLPALLWPTVVISGISFAIASFKSALPAALTLAAVIPLLILGFNQAASIALFVANASVAGYAIGFALHGGRIRVRTPS